MGLPLLINLRTFVADEALGNFAFSILVACILLIVCIILNYFVPLTSTRSLAIAWSMLGVVVIGFTIALYLVGVSRDRDTVLILAMSILAFPSSIAVVVLYALLSYLLSNCCSALAIPEWVEATMLWSVMAVLGYWQWFVAISRIEQRMRGKS